MASRISLVAAVVLALVVGLLLRVVPSAPRVLALAASPVASPLAVTPVAPALPSAADLGISPSLGVDVTTLAAAPIDSAGASTLIRLERVTVPEDGEAAMRTPAGPELLYSELGTATVVDAFGLSAPLAPGQQATLVPGSVYTLRNVGTAPASLLRLALGDPSAPPDAASQTLLETTLPSPPDGPAMLLIALASFQPGADTGSFTASGPVGVLVNAGTLTVTSPSGLEAPLTPGQGLVFPAGVPQRERNVGTEPVAAILVAVAPMGQPLVAAVPTPTPVPTATLEPTATPIPTATSTPQPTPTPAPTATPEPTSTPQPTPTPVPVYPEGTVIYEATASDGGFSSWELSGGWTLLDGSLVNDGSGGTVVVPIDTSSIHNLTVEVDLIGLEGTGGFEGFYIGLHGMEFGYQKIESCWKGAAQTYLYINSKKVDTNVCIAAPSDWHTYSLTIDDNRGMVDIDGTAVFDITDNRLLRGREGDIWIAVDPDIQVQVDSVRVIYGDNGPPTVSG